jgi:hypothetical protein
MMGESRRLRRQLPPGNRHSAMYCLECGVDLPGPETCIDRFHALLAAEATNDELRRMHGLTVLIYYLQHPTLTKPWCQEYGRRVLQRVFGRGERWQDVLLETHPRGVGRRRAAAVITRLKSHAPQTMPDWVITWPNSDELTILSVDAGTSMGQAASVMQWVRSVADHRYLRLATAG